MLLRVNLQIDRSSPEGIAWANRVRAALSSANAADPSVRWHLLVDAAPDSVVFIYENFGTLVGITVAVIFAILAAAFQSAAISLRSLVSLAAMEICVFGAATGIYVDGVLRDSPGVLETFSPDTGLFWLMPLLAFSLTAGLGLDYGVCCAVIPTPTGQCAVPDGGFLMLPVLWNQLDHCVRRPLAQIFS